MLARGAPSQYGNAPGFRAKQSTRQSNGCRLPRTIRTDETEHFATGDRERDAIECADGAIRLADALKTDCFVCHPECSLSRPGISASTGIPGFRIPSRLSVVTLIRYTSFVRSSAVCTFRGVNSACGEMKVIVPCTRCPASVTRVTAWPSLSWGTSGSSTYTFAHA